MPSSVANLENKAALSACGEAAHPDRERALAKALREFISARVRKPFCHGSLANVAQIAPRGYLDLFKPSALRNEDDRALQEMRRWLALDHQQFFDLIREPIFTERERVRFSTLPTVPWTHADDAQTRLDLLQSRLAADGLDIFYVDFTPDGSSVTVLKAIAPGLEVETMTYQRIGGRNLRRLLERGSPLNWARRSARRRIANTIAFCRRSGAWACLARSRRA